MKNANLRITAIPALKDNYIWSIRDVGHNQTIIVDPGEAAPVMHFLKQHHLHLAAILLTHHHFDHSKGAELLSTTFAAPVYGSDKSPVNCITHRVQDGEQVHIEAFPAILCLAVPGHTLDHTAYLIADHLFTGDTLFAAGCGRLFEGTAADLYASLQKLANLGDSTNIYCGHEYTLANLQFAQTIEPDNRAIAERLEKVAALRAANQPSLPTTLLDEKATNPFLRCDQARVIAAINTIDDSAVSSPLAVFTALRKHKDHYKG